MVEATQPRPLGAREGVTIWHDATRQEIFAWRVGEADPAWRARVPAGNIERVIHQGEEQYDRVPDVRLSLSSVPCWVSGFGGPLSDFPTYRGHVVCVDLATGEVTFVSSERTATYRARNDEVGTWIWLREHDESAALVRLVGRPVHAFDVRHAAVDLAGGYAWIVEGLVRERIASSSAQAPSSFPELPLDEFAGALE